MADTKTVTVVNTEYTLVSAVAEGYITNRTGDVVYHCVSALQPSADTFAAHILDNGESLPFSFSAAVNVWAKTANVATGKLVVTEG